MDGQSKPNDGQSKPNAEFGVVRAQRIEILGQDGSRRIEIGTSDIGDAVFRLRDATGTVRAVVSVQDDTPRVRLLDRKGTVRFCCILRDDQPGLELIGSDGEPRMVMFLRAHEDEAPDIYFTDHDGDPRFGIAMDYNGHRTLAAKDDAGRLQDVIWARNEPGRESEPLR